MSKYILMRQFSGALELINVNQLQQFHAQLVHHALHRQAYWVERLISFCTRSQAPSHYASNIFESAEQTTARLFNNMLWYYSKSGDDHAILKLFHRMQNSGFKPDHFPYPLVIKSAGAGGVLYHSLLIKTGVDSGKYVRNVLASAYGKYGPISAARQVFDEMTNRTVADWNAIISGYWNWGNADEAKRLFDSFPEKNVITWTSMVTGYSKIKDLEVARTYFDRMPVKNTVSWNAMLLGYAQNGHPEEALSFLHEMEGVGIEPKESTWAALMLSCSSQGDPKLAEAVVKMVEASGVCMHTILRTAILDMYAKCGCIDNARKVFNEMGEDMSLVTWNSMISGYMRAGDFSAAKVLFDQIPERDVVTWNSMAAGYVQNGESAMAIEVFKEMMKAGVTPDEATMVSVISACGNLGALELGKWVLEVMTENCVKMSVLGYNSVITMYTKSGSMDEAKATFDKMETRDVVSYNALITGFAAHDDAVEAIKLVQEIKGDGIEPNGITYTGVLAACSHAGLLEEGKRVFESIEAPDPQHYTCMVDLLGRVGKLDEAKRMVEEMPMKPHVGVYVSLLNASRKHKRVDLGEFAANKLFEMEPGNSGNYVLLCNLYASVGMWRQVDKIRKLMKMRGLIKKTTVGSSWIDHDGNIHLFKVGDHSHEQSGEIYGVLAKLKRKMKAAGYVEDKCDIESEEKEEMVGIHSEKLAVAFGLLVGKRGTVIRVWKKSRICWDCHTAIKMISKLEDREIVVRDNNRFHQFKDGLCSCSDYW